MDTFKEKLPKLHHALKLHAFLFLLPFIENDSHVKSQLLFPDRGAVRGCKRSVSILTQVIPFYRVSGKTPPFTL